MSKYRCKEIGQVMLQEWEKKSILNFKNYLLRVVNYCPIVQSIASKKKIVQTFYNISCANQKDIFDGSLTSNK